MRLRLALLACLVVASGCGTTGDTDAERPKNVPLREVELPELDPAVPAFAVSTGNVFDEDSVALVRDMKDVAIAAPVAIEKLKVRSGDSTARLTVGSIDPLEYRPIAPAPTRDADFVWTSLLAGEAVVTYQGAERLHLDTEVAHELSAGKAEIPVGAFADNGIPNFADVMVDAAHGKRLGLTKPRLLLVGARPDTPVGGIGDALHGAFPNAEIRRLLPSDLLWSKDPEATGAAYGGVIGYMRYTTLPDGYIKPDPTWIATNIATGDVPIVGTVTCHRLIFPQLRAALDEIESNGLSDRINPADYGGCYVPRFISRDPTRALSMHAFGLAIDFNVSENLLNTEGNMDPEVVAIFKKWGFEWGGDWETPKDPMHFEVVRLMEP